MTLNAVIALILRYFLRNSTDFQADYMTAVEDRPMMSVKYCLPVLLLAKTITHPAARSTIAEHLVISLKVFSDSSIRPIVFAPDSSSLPSKI